jgi:hypothetical protein
MWSQLRLGHERRYFGDNNGLHVRFVPRAIVRTTVPTVRNDERVRRRA